MSDLQLVRARLKSGEYDGTDIMAAWIAIDRLTEAQAILRDVRPMLNGVRGTMEAGLGRDVMSNLVERIDRNADRESAP